MTCGPAHTYGPARCPLQGAPRAYGRGRGGRGGRGGARGGTTGRGMMPQAFNGYGAYPQMQMAPMPYGYYFFPTAGAHPLHGHGACAWGSSRRRGLLMRGSSRARVSPSNGSEPSAAAIPFVKC